jgi:hypothetical protein
MKGKFDSDKPNSRVYGVPAPQRIAIGAIIFTLNERENRTIWQKAA